MKLSEARKIMEQIEKEHGDLDLLQGDGFSVDSIRVRIFDEDIPDWNVKAGDKVAETKSY